MGNNRLYSQIHRAALPVHEQESGVLRATHGSFEIRSVAHRFVVHFLNYVAALQAGIGSFAGRAVTFSTVIPCRASSLVFSGCSFLAVSVGISARVSGRVFSAPSRNTFTLTLVPGAISETCMRSSALLFTGVLLMSRMMSPFSKPAFWAGLLGVTSPTRAPRTSGSWKALAMAGVTS